MTSVKDDTLQKYCYWRESPLYATMCPMPELVQQWEPRTTVSYPIKLHLRYDVMSGGKRLCSGEGTTVSISRIEVLFDAPEELPIDTIVRLCIDWPISGLALDVQGRTVQSGQQIAVEILRHGFRPAQDRNCTSTA